MSRGVHGGMGVRGRGCVWHGGMHGRGHVWQGCVCGRGHAWCGSVHGRGVCMAGGRAWQILRDTVNEWAVRISLKCILVSEKQTAKILRSFGFLISKLCNVTILIFLIPNICPHYNYWIFRFYCLGHVKFTLWY